MAREATIEDMLIIEQLSPTLREVIERYYLVRAWDLADELMDGEMDTYRRAAFYAGWKARARFERPVDGDMKKAYSDFRGQ